MSLSLLSSSLAISPLNTSSFVGTGGTEPYVYSVAPGGVGGSINASTGIYTAPAAYGSDVIIVTDDDASTAQLSILVGHPYELLCDIIRREMSLSAERVYIYNQKIKEPIDQGIYIVLQILNEKPFGNINRGVDSESGFNSSQAVNTMAQVSIDIKSRSLDALYRKNEIIMALKSDYSARQQQANAFYFGKLPTSFVNLSQLDASAIPYRFNITVQMQYAERKLKAVDYYDNFQTNEILNNT